MNKGINFFHSPVYSLFLKGILLFFLFLGPSCPVHAKNTSQASNYKVKRGDTLGKIALRYGVSVKQLRSWNGLKTDKIINGQSLIIRNSDPDTEYIVKKGDNLFSISRKFDVGIGLLCQLNHLNGNRIYPGQKLQLRPSILEDVTHIVREGETLSSIALKYRIKLHDLKELNDIKGSKILINQKLRLRPTPASTHMVEKGDALWEIALAYGMSVKELKRLNGLNSNTIYPGQSLHLSQRQSDSLDFYTVQQGDCLSMIARLHQMSVSELKKENRLQTAIIFPGDKLKVRPLLRSSRQWLNIRDIDWDDLMMFPNGAGKFRVGNGPYYYSRPDADYQKHSAYFESSLDSPLRNYKLAQKLWLMFERKVDRLGRLSNTLYGWHIVLDPGHGGLDPGAIVKTLDGNDNHLFIVEDEYVYDVALRVYVLLRLHGATVTVTLLSPNHLIRHSTPPTRTFVNEKNEVYNSYSINKSNKWAAWPNGGYDGNISNRVRIARDAFKGQVKNRCIFLSFHADVEPRVPEAPLVLYYESPKRVDGVSKKFAQALLPALGAGSYARGQNLAVLRNNPAKLKVLLELRNLAFTDHAWALRFEELRQRDAEKVVRGILDYIRPDTPKYSAQKRIHECPSG